MPLVVLMRRGLLSWQFACSTFAHEFRCADLRIDECFNILHIRRMNSFSQLTVFHFIQLFDTFLFIPACCLCRVYSGVLLPNNRYRNSYPCWALVKPFRVDRGFTPSTKRLWFYVRVCYSIFNYNAKHLFPLELYSVNLIYFLTFP